MSKYLKIILMITILTFFIICVYYFFTQKSNITEIEDDIEQNVSTQELIEELGVNGDEELYVISSDENGRNTLAINPSIEYKVSLYGLVKNEKPTLENIDDVLNEIPNKGGLWIEEKSQDVFMKYINEVTTGEYYIDSEGFLQIKNQGKSDLEKDLYNIINKDKLFIIGAKGENYIVDAITGEIMVEPFEEMDPYMVYEYSEDKNSAVIVLTTNSANLLTSEEIVKALIDLMKNIDFSAVS